MTDIFQTDPDCPNCGTRCRPKGVVWECVSCDLVVMAGAQSSTTGLAAADAGDRP